VPRTILGLCDSDSFVKWGATLLDGLPGDWAIDLVIVATALTASERQIRDAVSGTRFADRRLNVVAISDVLADRRLAEADAVFVCCRGPIAELLLAELSARGERRPVLVSGLPGISVPAKWRGIAHRAQADLFVLHSKREVADYQQLAAERGADVTFTLATLPFAQHRTESSPALRDSIIFATQAIVPRALGDRQRLARILVAVAEANPDLRVVLKVRALAGEPQTHVEEHPLESLLPPDVPSNLVVEAGPMSGHLDRAVGFASVSSTAVMEAIAAQVPSLLLHDFGVDRELINEVFIGSGLLGGSEELIDTKFRQVNDRWLDANYFHADEDNSLTRDLVNLFATRDRRLLPARAAVRRSRGGALRRAWDRRLALGKYDTSTLGTVAWVVGMPISKARQLRRGLTARREV
jgi:hypothetical protein